MDPAGYVHPITLNLYTVGSGTPPALGTNIATVTQNFLIPWRPVADPTCTTPTAWRANDGNCYNGFAFTIVFDLRSLNLTLPDQLIFGIAYNTNTWGYQPIGQPGPYESLNVGTANVGGVGIPPYIGTDVEPDAVFWNTSYGPFYADGGAGGVGIFRRDTGWTDYSPAVEFTAFTVATTKDGCKKEGWRSLSRSDGSPFRNQGDCVSWVNNPNHPIKGGGKGPKAHLLLDD